MWGRAGSLCKRGIRRLSTAGRRTVEDEGDWSYHPEWWGTDMADGGLTVFRMPSDHGNGVVSVVAYPCSKPAPEKWPTVENWLQQRYAELHPDFENNEQFKVIGYQWRVLRFNDYTRQSTVKVMAACRKSDPASIYLMPQPNCLPVPYIKSMVSAGLTSLVSSGYDLFGAVAGKRGLSVLCIGHGGGNLPLFLASKIKGGIIDSIEIDPVVIAASVQIFAAASRGGVFGVAQCVKTVTASGCADCLSVALGNLKGCPPDADGRAVDAGCFMRYSDVNFFGSYPTVSLDALLESSGGSSGKAAVIGGVVGGVAVILLLGLVLVLWRRRSRKSKMGRRGDILGATELQGPVNFHYKDLKSATKNFKEENKLGEGGFGDVYKGVLRNGNIVAVKRLTISQTSRAKEDFKSEVKLISNVHHRNLVRMLGCSSKGPELLLVYEYMANSSLDKFLFGERRGTLNWKQRFDIIVGMSRGLAYLHNDFHVRIIHRDIKSSNILLDGDFQPKIADFGLARLLPGDQSHLSTKFAGTLGYTAPEYAIHGQLSEKVDTYSYGVVLLEIISGRKSNDTMLEPETQYLLEWAWKLYEKGEVMRLVDGSLNQDEYNPEEVKRVIEIALCCTQSTVAARPTMSDVVVLLLSRVGPMLHPARPTFIDAINRVHGDISSTGSSSTSKATVSITEFSAR